jgi:hypothetical protein
MRRLSLSLILAISALGVLIATNVHDLTRSAQLTTFGTVGVPVEFYQSLPGSAPTLYLSSAISQSAAGAMSVAQWWRSAPTLAVAGVTLALLIAAVVFAARRGAHSTTVIRLLESAGLLALIGGPVAVLIASLAPLWANGGWTHTTLWAQALIWAVLGGGLLGFRDLLIRASAMRAELDGVI